MLYGSGRKIAISNTSAITENKDLSSLCWYAKWWIVYSNSVGKTADLQTLLSAHVCKLSIYFAHTYIIYYALIYDANNLLYSVLIG